MHWLDISKDLGLPVLAFKQGVVPGVLVVSVLSLRDTIESVCL